jgi:DNA-binding NarL/FixJ family response regulator
MAALGSRLWSAGDSLAQPSSGVARSTRAPAVIWSENADTRLLLRGLLRLHLFPVLHEVATSEELVGLPPLSEPTVLVVDAESDSPGWQRTLPAVLSAHPEVRALVLLPPGDGSLEPAARAAGATAVVVRPFAIQDFVRALTATAETRVAPIADP